MRHKTIIQCLLFVLDNSNEAFVLLPSCAFEEHKNVCELFVQNSVKFLQNDIEYPILQEALERDQVQVLELLAISCGREACDTVRYAVPFIPVAVEAGNEKFVKQIFGKYAGFLHCPIIPSNDTLVSIDEENSETIERLLMFKADIRYKSAYSETLLHFAVKRQNKTLVRLLLKHNANIDAVSKDGSTALHLAVAPASCTLWCPDFSTDISKEVQCLVDHLLEILELLLKAHANVNVRNHNGLTPLHIAATMCKPVFSAIVKALLAHGADVNATVIYGHSNGVTPLCLAVENENIGIENDNLEVVKCLLEQGADPNLCCYDDQTILELAVRCKNSDIIESILKSRKIPVRKNKISKKVCCKAVFEDDGVIFKLAELLQKYKFTLDTEKHNYTKVLHDAICKNDTATVKQLLESGVNVNHVYHHYNVILPDQMIKSMPLFTAVQNQANDVVQLLLNYNADVNARLDLQYGESKTPLDVTVGRPLQFTKPNIEAAMILLAENATFTNDTAWSLVSLAVRKKSPELLEEVLRKSAVNGETPNNYRLAVINDDMEQSYSELYFDSVSGLPKKELPSTSTVVADKNLFKVMEVLLQFGTDIDSRDEDGNTALHCGFGSEFVKYLIQRNADIEARNLTGRTPIFRRIERNDFDTVIELMKYGARIDVVDFFDESIFRQLALSFNEEKILEALLQFRFTDPRPVWNFNIFRPTDLVHTKSHNDEPFDPVENRKWTAGRLSFRRVPDMLTRHSIKLKAAFPQDASLFDFFSDEHLRLIADGDNRALRGKISVEVWRDFKTQCEAEVRRLKVTHVGRSSISYYDVLIKREHDVSRYLRNAGIFKSLASKAVKKRFPIYGEILSYQFEKGRFRRELLDQSLKQCHALVGEFKDLPKELKEEVLSYLTNRELEVAVYACKCVTSQSAVS